MKPVREKPPKLITRPVAKSVLALIERVEADYRRTLQEILVMAAGDEKFAEGDTWNLNLQLKRWEKKP